MPSDVGLDDSVFIGNVFGTGHDGYPNATCGAQLPVTSKAVTVLACKIYKFPLCEVCFPPPLPAAASAPITAPTDDR